MKNRGAIAAIIIALVFLLSANLTAHSYDYFGNDMPGGGLVTNPNECEAACNKNSSCVAWTYVRPGLKHPTSAVCFLKNAVPVPSLNSVCEATSDCKSGLKRNDGWCGETPSRTVAGSTVFGQDEVLMCPSGQSCRPKITQTYETCWIFFQCRGPKIQSTDFFCQQ